MISSQSCRKNQLRYLLASITILELNNYCDTLSYIKETFGQNYLINRREHHFALVAILQFSRNTKNSSQQYIITISDQNCLANQL